jgi:hypothetical protein
MGNIVLEDLLRLREALKPPVVVVWVLSVYPEEHKDKVTLMDLAPQTADLYLKYGIKTADKMVVVHPDLSAELFEKLRKAGQPYTTERPWLEDTK